MRAVLLVVATLALLVVGDAVRGTVETDRSRIDAMRECLEQERGYDVFDVEPDSPAARASEPAFRTVVETNEVTFAVARSRKAAAALESAYLARAQKARALVERRGEVVYAWERPPSPTQRQALYDCSY